MENKDGAAMRDRYREELIAMGRLKSAAPHQACLRFSHLFDKLLAIVAIFKAMRHYLEQLKIRPILHSDHDNFRTFHS